jgi:hypothetical protein
MSVLAAVYFCHADNFTLSYKQTLFAHKRVSIYLAMVSFSGNTKSHSFNADFPASLANSVRLIHL